MSEPLLGTGGEGVVSDAAETTLFDAATNGGAVEAYHLENMSSTLEAKIRVHGLHLDRTAEGGTDGMAILKVGQEKPFVSRGGGIRKITAKAATTGTLTLRGFVQGR